MPHIREFLRLPAPRQWLLVRAAMLMAVVRLGLSVLPFRVIWRLLNAGTLAGRRTDHVSQLAEQHIVWAVGIASQYIPAASCLTQALTAQVLLTRNGCGGDIRIGVKKSADNRLEAHAWIEREGRVVIGNLPELSQYTVLPTLEHGAV